MWLSDEERLRVAFKRCRTSAERVDLDRSPFFPRTAGEYAGLKAGLLEDRAARLRAKVAEREMAVRARGWWAREGGRWRRVFVVGKGGRVEERVVPVYYGGLEEGGGIGAVSKAGGFEMGGGVESAAVRGGESS